MKGKLNTHEVPVKNEICAMQIHQIKKGQKHLVLPMNIFFAAAKCNPAPTLLLIQTVAYCQNYAEATTSFT